MRRAFTTLEIDGQEYGLLWDFNAIAEAEAACKCNLLQGVVGFLLDTATFAQYRGLLFAALQAKHPKLTVEQVGRLIRTDTLADIRRALAYSHNAALPEKKRMTIVEMGETYGQNSDTKNSGTTSGQRPEST